MHSIVFRILFRFQVPLSVALGIMVWTPSLAERSKKDSDQRPEIFVALGRFAPEIPQDLKYTGTNNFTADIVRGYQNGQCWITRPAAEALKQVQAELQVMGLSLLVFDAYRPQHAVDHFAAWAQDESDSIWAKARFYPNLNKSELFPKGYIAKRSGHTRGSTVDLTICHLAEDGSPIPLDMGTRFDYFGIKASTAYRKVTPQQKANRLLLKTMMEKHGFKHYALEWWHFTLVDEPFPDTYFNFPITADAK